MFRVPSCRVGQMCQFAAVIGCPGCELQNRVTQYIQYFLEIQFDFRSAVETYENSACGGHSCVCRDELSELGQGRNEVLRVRPARGKQQSEHLALSLRILSAPPPRQMASAPIMASVQITRRTGCLGGGICNDRIRSHKLTCRVAEVGSISGLTSMIVARHDAVFVRRTARRTGARHRRKVYGSPTPRTARRRKIVASTRNEAPTLLRPTVSACTALLERWFYLPDRVANRSVQYLTPKTAERRGLMPLFFRPTRLKGLCFAPHLSATPQHVPPRQPGDSARFWLRPPESFVQNSVVFAGQLTPPRSAVLETACQKVGHAASVSWIASC
ncbi:Hypothetical_protein [Hexamita inflata]|uniref:Hypothetical_protein n=1 Tax=Hexamita inflata TaxID=28002 RepID=A0AA86NKX0_9EUKA|nr:Hypothetical protein HINF_LOCUS8600 [Hexamita inflata]